MVTVVKFQNLRLQLAGAEHREGQGEIPRSIGAQCRGDKQKVSFWLVLENYGSLCSIVFKTLYSSQYVGIP